jgi:hypothetical protein
VIPADVAVRAELMMRFDRLRHRLAGRRLPEWTLRGRAPGLCLWLDGIAPGMITVFADALAGDSDARAELEMRIACPRTHMTLQ